MISPRPGRRYRLGRLFSTYVRFVLPCWRARQWVGQWIRQTFPITRRWAYLYLGWVFFDCVIVPRFVTDELQLRSYVTDIRQVTRDNSLFSAEELRRCFSSSDIRAEDHLLGREVNPPLEGQTKNRLL